MSQLITLLNIAYSTITPLFLIAGTVVFISKKIQLDPRIFSRAIIYIFSPCLLLTTLSTTEMAAAEIGTIVFAVIVSSVAMALLATALAWLLGFERRLASTFVLTAFIMNAINFGLPYMEFAFGKQGLERAVVFMVGQVIMVYTLGIFVASRGESSIGRSLRQVFAVPLPYALSLGILLNLTGWSLPLAVSRATTVLGQATVPCTLVVLGLQLGRASLSGKWLPIIAAGGVRFFGGAAVAYIITLLFGMHGLTQQVFIMQSSMPIGVTSGVLATEFGGDGEFAAAAILFTTLLSAIFLSLLLYFVR